MLYFKGLVGFCRVDFFLVETFVEDVSGFGLVGLVLDGWFAAVAAAGNRKHVQLKL